MKKYRRYERYLYKGLMIATLTILGVIILYPIYITFMVSFDRSIRFAIPTPPPIFPKQFSNLFYRVVFTNLPFIRYYFNTLFITCGVFVFKLVLCYMCAYAISKGNFKLKKLSFILVLMTMMVPFQALLLPSYILFHQLKLVDTWMSIILMSSLSPLTVFLMKQFLDELPNELRDSARIDGANELSICYRIYFPLCGPIIATVGILTIVGEWNNYIWAALMLRTYENFTIPLALANFSFDKGVIIGPRAAGAMAGAIPLLVIFLILQKYVVASIATSGIKQ